MSLNLKKKLDALTLAKIDAQLRVRAAETIGNKADALPDGELDPYGRRSARNAATAAKNELSRIDMELQIVKAEVSRQERLAQRPVVEARLSAGKAIIAKRNAVAAKIQSGLDIVREGLIELDEATQPLHLLERQRDPEARGHAPSAMVMNPTYRYARLRHPLWEAFRKSVYRGLVSRFDLPHLAPARFDEAERWAGTVLLRQWQADLAALDALEKREEQTA